MRKTVILFAILVVGLAGISTISSFGSDNYIKIINHTSSFTKAICTEENFCQDYEVFCNKTEVIYMAPITGAVVQFSPSWEDPRSEKLKNRMC